LNYRDVTNVLFDVSLAQLIDVDEKNQIVTTNQWITMVCRESFRKFIKYFSFLDTELDRSEINMGSIRMG